MLKRGLMILLFLVLLSSLVSAFNFSTLANPSPAIIYEGANQNFEISINNYNQSQRIKEIHINLSKVNITNVILLPLTTWRENHNSTYIHWFNDTVDVISKNDAFEFNAFILPVLADTNVTLLVTKINVDNTTATENHTITILDDTTPPNITSINPLNSTLANTIQTITANVVEAESQLQLVNYTYGDCNGTNTTITLSCNGSICTGTANFTNCNEGNTTWYALTAANNVGGVTPPILGNITFHGIPPNVTAVMPTPGTMYTESEAIYITANATDETAVDKVRADITYPNGTTVSLQLSQAAGNKYSKLFNAPNLLGQYNVTIVANDTSGNVNNTKTTNFKIVPDYTFTITLNPSTARPGRTVKINGTIKLLNSSDIPENQTTIEIQGTQTNKTLTNGTFSHTFNAPTNKGTYNIYVKVYANSGYNYSKTKKLTVSNPSTSSSGSGWGWDFDEFEGNEGTYIEDSAVTEAPEEEPEPEDAGVAKAPAEPEPEPSAEQVIEEILNKPETNQITGSAVGLGGATSLLALLLLVLGVATLAYSNARIRGHVHKFAKEKIGSKFKKKEKTTKAFSDEEWEEYFKRLRED